MDGRIFGSGDGRILGSLIEFLMLTEGLFFDIQNKIKTRPLPIGPIDLIVKGKKDEPKLRAGPTEKPIGSVLSIGSVKGIL